MSSVRSASSVGPKPSDQVDALWPSASARTSRSTDLIRPEVGALGPAQVHVPLVLPHRREDRRLRCCHESLPITLRSGAPYRPVVDLLIVVATGESDAVDAGELLSRHGAASVESRSWGRGRVIVAGGPFEAEAAASVAALVRAAGWPSDVRPTGGGHLAAWQAHTAPTVVNDRLWVCFPWSEFDRDTRARSSSTSIRCGRSVRALTRARCWYCDGSSTTSPPLTASSTSDAAAACWPSPPRCSARRRGRGGHRSRRRVRNAGERNP